MSGAHGSHHPRKTATSTPAYLALQGSGCHPEASGSLLKCVVVTKGAARYTESSTTVVTMNQVSPFGSVKRS